jgi:hypothetical protein
MLGAAYASLATSEECELALRDDDGRATVSASEPGFVQRYRVRGPAGSRLSASVSVAADGANTSVRVALVSDDVPVPTDGGVPAGREIVVTTDASGKAAAELELSCAAAGCDDYGVALELEHTAGTAARVSFTVQATIDDCKTEVEYFELARE